MFKKTAIKLNRKVQLKAPRLTLREAVSSIVQNKYLYIMIAPCIVFYIVFCYFPMYGILLAFKDFYPNLGITASPWVGWANFKYLFEQQQFWHVLRNTVFISLGRVALGSIAPVLIALLINELSIRLRKYKKVVQTVYTFPKFLSWVIIAGIVRELFANRGAINGIIHVFGGEPINFLSKGAFFIPLLFLSDIWKEAGWASIIYFASMSSIDVGLYEAAEIDGANRWQKMRKITLPHIKPLFILLLILSMGSILSAGFDQIFNLYNPLVYDVSDIIDTYVYRLAFGTTAATNPGISTALGLFKSVISFFLLIITDRIAKMTGERGVI